MRIPSCLAGVVGAIVIVTLESKVHASPPSINPTASDRWSTSDVQQAIDRSIQEREEKTRTIEATIEETEDVDVLRTQAQRSLNQLDQQAEEYESSLIGLSKIRDIEVGRLSWGLISSVIANLLGILGLIARYPSSRLERRLKRLEIMEKEHALREKNILLRE